MHWLADVLLELLGMLWPWGGERRVDRSVVGKSRFDEETARFWKWAAAGVLAVAGIVWLATRA